MKSKTVSSIVLLSVLALGIPAYSQASNDAQVQVNKPQEVLVRIQQETPKTPDLPTSTVAKANEWVEFGSNLGKAFDAGLTSLTDHAEKFSKTDAGHFTMAVIAWKIAGRDAMELAHTLVRVPFGILAELVWLFVYIWFIRKFCRAYSVVLKRSGPFWNRTVEYKVIDEYCPSDRVVYMIVSTVLFFASSSILIACLIT